MSTDHNLLFGVLALQADLITQSQFAEACSSWAARKSVPLADVLVGRGWLTADDVAVVNRLLAKKLERHGGAKASLLAVMPDEARRSLCAIADPELMATVAPAGPAPAVLLTAPVGGDSRDRYTTTRLHATGGLGRVWLAHDAGLNREVALKELLPERSGVGEAADRFLREARITGQLEHPGIVPVYELVNDPAGPSPFYTMRFIRGRTLGEAIAGYHQRRAGGTARPLELRELLTAFATVCQAVAYAHSRRVIHRDLKPANVVLGDFGEVIVLDWGLAKVLGEPESVDLGSTVAATQPVVSTDERLDTTKAGQVLGTPHYMAPEQAAGDVALIGERTDVYGLGAILYEILTGTVPFHGKTLALLLAQVRTAPPPRPASEVRDVPRPLEAICLKCLSKSPEDRYAGPKELADDVAHFLADEPVAAYPDPPGVRVRRWARRHRTLVAGSALAAAVALPVLLVSLVLVANSADRERSARLAADAARDEAEANFEKAVRSAELVSEELARGIKPIAGTQSKTVAEILTRAEAVYDDLLTGPHPPARARLNKAKMLVLSSDVYRGMHRLAPAGERATRAADLCRELLAEDPDGREYRTTLAAALHRRGWAVWERAQGGPALADFAEAIRLFDADGATAETAPDEAFALASCLTISGNIRLDFGDTAGAKPLYDRGLALREALSRKFPDDPRMRVQLAISLERVGLFERQFGKKAEGTAKLRRAVEATAAAFASDRGNQEVAVHYIRTLNSLAFAELEEDRPAALGRLKAARELAETFARRDPDSNEWERESVRARWTLGELEQEDWVRLPPEKRVEARKTQVRLLGEWIRVSDRRLGLSPEGGYWLSDRGNYRARLAVALLALADAGDEPAANRLRAVQVSALAVADYERVLAFEPKSYDQKTGLLYALSVAVKAAVASKPAAAALALHWRYAATSVRTYHDLCRDHPENPDGPRQLALALFGRVGVPRAFGDDWAKLAADPAALAAQIEFGEALPDRAALAFPKAAKLLAAVRERTGDQFRKVAEKTPLPERGKKLLESLSRKE